MADDFIRVQTNVQKMIGMKAPEQDIDGYLAQEGLTPDEFKTRLTVQSIAPQPSSPVAASSIQQQQPPLDGSFPTRFQAAGVTPTGQTDAPLLYGVAKGVKDVLDGTAQFAAHALPSSVINAGQTATDAINNLAGTKLLSGASPQQVDKSIEDSNKQYDLYREQQGLKGFDGGRLIGNVAGAIPISMVVPGAGPAGVIANVGRGALAGALNSAVMPVTTPGDYWQQKRDQVKLGAGVGAATGPVAPLINKMISPNISQDVQFLMSKGVTPTPGQLLGQTVAKNEDKLSSVPIVGDMIKNSQRRTFQEFNTAAYNDALAPIGQKVTTTEVGHKGVQAVQQQISDAYDTLLPKLNWQVDAQVANDIGALRQQATQLPANEAKYFDNLIQEKIKGQAGSGSMSGEAYKTLDSSLGADSRNFGKSGDAYQQKLGGLIADLRTSMRGALDRSNPQFQGDLKAIDTAQANYYRLQNAAAQARDGSGVFTPAQLQAAVRATDTSRNKAQFATGNALMQDLSGAGRRVLGTAYPDSGTAGRYFLPTMLGASAVAPKAAIAAAAGALPYTRVGQKLLAQALTQRPASAPQIAAGSSKLFAALSKTAVPLLLGQASGFNATP